MNLKSIEQESEEQKKLYEEFKEENKAKIEHWLNQNPARQVPIWYDKDSNKFIWLNRKSRRLAGL